MEQTHLLQLTSSNIPLVFQNPLSIQVTSLGYYDKEEEHKYRKEAERMVCEEMSSMPQKDYLENYPYPNTNTYTVRSNEDQINLDNYILNENPQSEEEIDNETQRLKMLISGNNVK